MSSFPQYITSTTFVLSLGVGSFPVRSIPYFTHKLVAFTRGQYKLYLFCDNLRCFETSPQIPRGLGNYWLRNTDLKPQESVNQANVFSVTMHTCFSDDLTVRWHNWAWIPALFLMTQVKLDTSCICPVQSTCPVLCYDTGTVTLILWE